MIVLRRQRNSHHIGARLPSERDEVYGLAGAGLEFNDFSNALSARLRLDALMTRETSLRDDLDLDSLQMLELVVLMDELGAEVFEEILPQLETVGDLYDHYVTRSAAERRIGNAKPQLGSTPSELGNS